MAGKFFYIDKGKKELLLSELRKHSSLEEGDIFDGGDHVLITADVSDDFKKYKANDENGETVMVIFHSSPAE